MIEARLPIPAAFALYPGPLVEAALYGLLAAATLFAFTVRRRVLAGGGTTVSRPFTAIASLGLWFGVGFAGRWIAFY